MDIYRPDLERLMSEDLPFTRVLEERRSRREPGERPVSVRDWADSPTLFRHALAATDDGNYLAHIGLGKALMGEKDCAGAAAQFQAVLTRYPNMREARAGLEAAQKEGALQGCNGPLQR